MENRLPKFGQNTGEYVTTAPPDHTGVCWASAIGAAMHGRLDSDHGEVAARRALAMLADGTAVCICTRPRAKRRGRR